MRLVRPLLSGLPVALFALTLARPTPLATQEEGADQGEEYQDTYADSVARQLHSAAVANWLTLDETIARYTALIEQRIAGAIRTPLKDRILYRSETTVRTFWDQDYDPVVQVLGTRSQYPGRQLALEEGSLDWLDDMPFDQPFEPGGDRLFFGFPTGDPDDDTFEPDGEGFWFDHPLATDATSNYRYRSGDTLTLSLPDGRRWQVIQLDVVPREANSHRITGTLWIEPESGALVRAVYHLSQQFDAIRDVPELQREDARGEFRFVPGLFKPWTFDLTVAVVDYSFWEFQTWLPRSMRIEGEIGAGVLKMPLWMDLSYQIESVTLNSEISEIEESYPAPTTFAGETLQEVHFKTRAEAMAFISELLSEGEAVDYMALNDSRGSVTTEIERNALLIAPTDLSQVAVSPHLPPPIWEDAPGFIDESEIEDYVRALGDLPVAGVATKTWGFNWGWARSDLTRYNRVEGSAIGGSLDRELGGAYSVGLSGWFGLADLQPKLRLDLQRSTPLRQLSLGLFRELHATDPEGGYFGLGNSTEALLFGRDNGEYYRSSGLDLTWRPPVGSRQGFSLRAYGERQEQVPVETDFALLHAFDDEWKFRPNVAADNVDEVGVELRYSPWWGTDPSLAQFGLELYGQGAFWRLPDQSENSRYARASAVLRSALPLAGEGLRTWRLGMEAGVGHSWGSATAQRSWFLGAAGTLRGYPASATSGHSFLRGRLEVARTFEGLGVSVFGDGGWAGSGFDVDPDDVLYGIGIGGSLFDGLVRIDFSQGLTGSNRAFRVDMHLDAIL